ncbi:MAG: hypothetical protein H8E91_06810 [Planctomycetes bacterium]|nr:hypothetical protein [Planctomycetota bacterium]
MFQQFTTILILTAITLQGVFGGLQNSVSICLGGGHEHHEYESAEVIEHCEMECSHHNQWPSPIASDVDIDDCECTDLELSLITLLSTPRNSDDGTIVAWAYEHFTATTEMQSRCALWVPPDAEFTLGIKEQQLVVLRTTRLLL